MNSLILCELYSTPLHGNPELEGHYLVIGKFEPFTGKMIDEYNTDNTDLENENELENTIQFYRHHYNLFLNTSLCQNYRHNVIRNYITIISSNNYLNQQIAQCIVLPSQETVAILKTVWIRIIQRTWKKVFLSRKQAMNKLIISGNYQRLQGSTKQLPGLRGMLCNL